MRKLVLFLLLLGTCWGQTSVSGSASTTGATSQTAVPCLANHYYSTTFVGSEYPLREGSCWSDSGVNGGGRSNAQKNGYAFGNQNENGWFLDSWALLTGGVMNSDVTECIVLKNTLGTSGCCAENELQTRANFLGGIAPAQTGYEFSWSIQSGNDYYHMAPWLGVDFATGTWAGSPLGHIPADGDTICVSSIGSAHRLYANGFLIASGTDATYSTGKPGIGFYHGTLYNGLDSQWGNKSFIVGDQFGILDYNEADCTTTAATCAVTIASSSAGDNIVVCAGSVSTGATITAADNASGGTNTYTRRTSTNGTHAAAGIESTCFDSLNTPRGSVTTITVTWGANNAFRTVHAWRYKSANTASFDAGGGTTNAAGSGTTASGAAVTSSALGIQFAIIVPANTTSQNPKVGNEFMTGGIVSANGPAGASLSIAGAGSHQPQWLLGTSGDNFTSSTWAGK